MCLSASVSFAVSALLIPTGIYCIKTVLHKTAYLPFACVPLAFGLQQGFEGIVWLGINSNNPVIMHFGALAFLFFSHWFWLFWAPLLALYLEQHQPIQRICRAFVVIGALYGAFLYLPLLLNYDWLSATVIHRSIEYQARFIGDSIPVTFSRLFYTLTLLIPLLISSNLDVKIWGGLIALSAFISYLVVNYAFVSVWCFLAALLSLYIVYVILKANTLPSEPVPELPNHEL